MANYAANSDNAARDAWVALVAHAPKKLVAFCRILSAIVSYFLNGHAVVGFVRWLARTAGYIAESALMLATLYVTLNSVAHVLVTWILPGTVIEALNYLSIVSFSLLPELIVASAIQMTVDHWSVFARDRRGANPAWLWGSLYTAPTVIFLVMTVTTIASFTQSVGNPLQATGTALTIRVLTGWAYALIEILFAQIGKKSYSSMLDNLRAMVATQGATLSALRATEQGLRSDLERATTELESQRTRATDLEHDLRSAKGNIATLTFEKATILAERDELQERSDRLQSEITELKARVARREHTRAVARPDTSRSLQETGYVAHDDGQTMAIANEQGDTIIATGSPRERIKEAMLKAMANNEDLSYGAIAQAANAGYSTVKKYAKELQAEVAREITGEIAVVVRQEEPEM